MEEFIPVPLKCHKCNHVWLYRGGSNYRTTCGKCGVTIYLEKATLKCNDATLNRLIRGLPEVPEPPIEVFLNVNDIKTKPYLIIDTVNRTACFSSDDNESVDGAETCVCKLDVNDKTKMFSDFNGCMFDLIIGEGCNIHDVLSLSVDWKNGFTTMTNDYSYADFVNDVDMWDASMMYKDAWIFLLPVNDEDVDFGMIEEWYNLLVRPILVGVHRLFFPPNGSGKLDAELDDDIVFDQVKRAFFRLSSMFRD